MTGGRSKPKSRATKHYEQEKKRTKEIFKFPKLVSHFVRPNRLPVKDEPDGVCTDSLLSPDSLPTTFVTRIIVRVAS